MRFATNSSLERLKLTLGHFGFLDFCKTAESLSERGNSAGLLLRTFPNYLATNLGFEVKNIPMMSFDVGLEGYQPTLGEVFFNRLVSEVESLPGVSSAAVTLDPPVNLDAYGAAIVVQGRELSPQRSCDMSRG